MQHKSEHLVIGSGIAGLCYALSVAKHSSVTIITKRRQIDSNTWHAQGGIAAVTSKMDSFAEHLQDTLAAGDGLCNENIAKLVVENGPAQVKRLLSWGANFAKNSNSTLNLRAEGGHSNRRIVHAEDMSGQEIQQTLLRAVAKHPNISIFENHIAVNLITTEKLQLSQKNQCLGAYVLDINKAKVETFVANNTLLATGGAGKVYLYTSNPDIASGDGIALAYRAGAKVANLEFVQFHPTCLFHPQAKSFLLSEAMRGEGAKLRLKSGESFLEKYDARAELATRDIVARAIDAELKKTGDEYVLLDISHRPAKEILARFPKIYQNCLRFGFDITKDAIPVVPAAHYFCGGVVTDQNGQTEIGGLYACGEVACTGLHGANRLASNALLEGLVFAQRAATHAEKNQPANLLDKITVPDWDLRGATHSDEEVVITQNWDEIRRIMWNYVGIVRSDKRLARAKKRIDLLRAEIREYYWNFTITNNLIELRNLALVADLIIQSALQRRESRGLHCNIDYPNKKDDYLKDTILRIPPKTSKTIQTS